MDFLRSILPCFPLSAPPTFTEKDAVKVLKTREAAGQIVFALQNADKNSQDLQSQIDKIVHQAGGWCESIALAILSALENVLKAGSPMAGLLKESYDKACEAADAIGGFVKEHPVFCTVIALGILVLLAPYVLEWLGFAALGPIDGSWAAAWQARYLGYVPKKSLFSFLQRLGMVWGRAVGFIGYTGPPML